MNERLSCFNVVLFLCCAMFLVLCFCIIVILCCVIISNPTQPQHNLNNTQNIKITTTIRPFKEILVSDKNKKNKRIP